MAPVAEIWTATHYRPEFLRACIECIQRQAYLPASWDVRHVVIGLEDDPGLDVARDMGCRVIVAPAPQVTIKLMIALHESQADLAILADDDDLQPHGRVSAAIRAHEDGYPWSGVDMLYFLDLPTRLAMRWTATESTQIGLVGTSMSYSMGHLRRAAHAWGHRESGKDGPMSAAFRELGAPYQCITHRMDGPIIGIQHPESLWARRRHTLPEGEVRRRTDWDIRGEGDAQKVFSDDPRIDILSRLMGPENG